MEPTKSQVTLDLILRPEEGCKCYKAPEEQLPAAICFGINVGLDFLKKTEGMRQKEAERGNLWVQGGKKEGRKRVKYKQS